MGKSTTQKTEFPEPTEQEKALMQMTLDAFMPMYMQQAGYEVNKNQSNIADDSTYQRLNSSRDQLQQKLDELYSMPGGSDNSETLREINNLQKQMSSMDSQISTYERDYEGKIGYDVRKILSPELERLRSTYGEGSSEYKQAYEDYQMVEEEKYNQQQEIDSKMMDLTMKVLNGDLSISDEQKAQLQEMYAPVRTAVTQMYDNVRAEAEQTGKNLGEAITEFETRLQETGMNMGEALDALGTQIEQTGSDMNAALTNTIATRQELMKMGIEDTSGEITKNVAMNAARSGRTPDDPEYQMEIQTQVAREVQRGNLELGAMEAQGRLNIAERTGSGLENVAQQRVGVAERTGSGMEEAARMRYGVAERTGSIRERAAQEEGQANVGIEESMASNRYSLATGQPFNQISAGMNMSQYNQAIRQTQMNNAAAAMNTGYGYAQNMQRYRMAQPITTQTRGYGFGDFLGDAMGVAGGAASAYSGISTGSYYRGMS